jgi:hypothetical protein
MSANLAGAIGAVATLVVVAVAFGLIGLRWRPVRTFLVVIGPLYSLAILIYFLFEGTGSQCSGAGTTFRCWEISYASTWGVFGSALVGVVVILTLAPIASAWRRSRVPSLVAALALPVVIAIYILALWAWVPAWAGALAAAIAGPPSRAER